MLEGKHIVLGVTGGIAAYKSVMLLRLFKKQGAEVKVVMTHNAKQLVSPATFASLSGNPVISDFFAANTGEWHSHVDLGIWADLMVIAPTTANTLAKMATGVADNMLLTTYLSAKEKVMIAPAMDLDMWKHQATQRNLRQLREDGVIFVEPGDGELASGLSGKGRMAEPEDILKAVNDYFSSLCSLNGVKVLITAGPTYENIDPVRFIGNYSSGKMGFALAEAFAEKGAEVTVIAGPVSINSINTAIKRINVRSATEMLDECKKVFPDVDVAVFAAAVADYRPANIFAEKVKRENKEEISITFIRNPDIAATLGKEKRDRQLTVGFALESNDEEMNAMKKLNSKNFDWIVLNSINDAGAGFMTDTNKVTLYSKCGDKIAVDLKSKALVAKDIVEVLSRDIKKIKK